MRILILFCFSLLEIAVFAQSAVERMAKVLNQNDLFALQREYTKARDSLPTAIDAIAKVRLGVYFNRLQVDDQLTSQVKKTYTDLGIDHYTNLGVLISWQLHRQNRNDEAISYLDSMMPILKDQPEHLKVLKAQQKQYAKYRDYSLCQIKRPIVDAEVPLQVDTVGDGGLHFTFSGKMNDSLVKFTFDTGAPLNVISREIAEQYRFTSLHDTLNFGYPSSEMVLVDSLNIGGITIYDIPFCVVDMKAGNVEADRHFKQIKAILGVPLLNVLKEVQLDFKNKRFIFPVKTTSKSGVYSNIYWEPSGYITLETRHLGKQMLFLLDSGSGCGSLSSEYYFENRQQLQESGKADSMGLATVGKIIRTAYYWERNFQMEVAGQETFVPRVMVPEKPGFEMLGSKRGVFGADWFMSYSKVILNMEDMFMQVETK